MLPTGPAAKPYGTELGGAKETLHTDTGQTTLLHFISAADRE